MAAFCSSFYTARRLLLACTSESVRRSLGVRAGTRQDHTVKSAHPLQSQCCHDHSLQTHINTQPS